MSNKEKYCVRSRFLIKKDNEEYQWIDEKGNWNPEALSMAIFSWSDAITIANKWRESNTFNSGRSCIEVSGAIQKEIKQ